MANQKPTLTQSQVLAHNITRLRIKRGLKKEQLAEAASLHRVTVYDLEAARYADARASTLYRLSVALGSTVEALLKPPHAKGGAR